MTEPNRRATLPALEGTPHRRLYTGRDLDRVKGGADLRARTHRLMPDFVLEYLKGGAEDEAALSRERAAYADWRFVPRQPVDVSHRTLAGPILGSQAPLPLASRPRG